MIHSIHTTTCLDEACYFNDQFYVSQSVQHFLCMRARLKKSCRHLIETESAIEFNDQFLIDNGGGINVDRYAYGNPVLPVLTV